MMKLPGLCPKCDGHLDAMAAKSWGDGMQKLPFAPFLCSWCGSLFVLDIQRREIMDREECKRLSGVDPISAMEKNPALWDAIAKAREAMLSLPNRRRVIR